MEPVSPAWMRCLGRQRCRPRSCAIGGGSIVIAGTGTVVGVYKPSDVEHVIGDQHATTVVQGRLGGEGAGQSGSQERPGVGVVTDFHNFPLAVLLDRTSI